MLPIKRRQFLQFTGTALATLGLNQLDFLHQGISDSIFAQTLPRKLALLVGINQYRDSPLQGCVTDVELQRHLLIHRFGFNLKDIVILTDEKATRQGILTAFEEHLIKQAKPDDIVVFHFSGHATQVRDPKCEFPDCVTGVLVPVDSSPETFKPEAGITQPQLAQLLTALQTEKVTVVLDTVHAGSFEGRNGFAKGVLLAGCKRNQLAADTPFNGFSAGVFTYLLTQHLWQQTKSQPAKEVLTQVARSATRRSFTAQEPMLIVQSGSGYENQPIYFLEFQAPSAEAVITNVEGDRVELWLGGWPPKALEAFNGGAILIVVDRAGKNLGKIQLESRRGLTGRGKVIDAAPNGIQTGALLQEPVR